MNSGGKTRGGVHPSAPNPSGSEMLMACPDCGAACSKFADKCWLCGVALVGSNEATDVVVAEILLPPRPRYALSEWFFGGLTFLLGGVLLLIAIGAFAQNPGVGLGFLILVAPAVIAVLTREQRRRTQHQATGWADRFLTILVSLSLTIGIVGMLCVAGCVAFFLYCLATFSGPGYHP